VRAGEKNVELDGIGMLESRKSQNVAMEVKRKNVI